MKKYIIFGAGIYCINAITLLGKENVEFILDNDSSKWGKYIEEIPIHSPENKKNFLKNNSIIMAVSQKYQSQIMEQLYRLGANRIRCFQEIQAEYTKRKIENRIDYINIHHFTTLGLSHFSQT